MAFRKSAFLGTLVVMGVFLVGVAVAEPSKPDRNEVYQLQKLLVDTLDEVQRHYVKDVSRRQLVEAAIRGVLSELDPYSSYISQDEMRQFTASVESEFGGIGIQISVQNGQLIVLSPLVDTPAYRAGVVAGDRILKINGKSTEGITLSEAVGLLKGKSGTDVKLRITHLGSSKEKTFSITRERIHIKTVLGDQRKQNDTWDYMLDHQKSIGYLRITAFSRSTINELQVALDELDQKKVQGLILDLRFNPGGLLSSAIAVSDAFVSDGRIVSTQGRRAPKRTWDAKKPGTFESFPMVVLVNRYSASASEIVAACLQDHKRAVVMGEQTWGKGSVQNVIELERDKDNPNIRSALKLTTATYVRPSGKNIHRFPDSKDEDEWGVMPDKGYELKLTLYELAELDQYRRQRDTIKPHPPKTTKKPANKKPPASQPKKPPASQPKKPPASQPKKLPKEKNVDQPNPHKNIDQQDFVDTQLQMAIDYLSNELARAKP